MGASINYVDKQEGKEGVTQMSTILHKLVVNLSMKRGEKGVKNPVNVVYECPLGRRCHVPILNVHIILRASINLMTVERDGS